MNMRDVVLVVDDFPGSLSMLTEALESAGLTVLVALDGERALAIAERITPDIILMDAIMPEMDGFETCRRLKGNPELAQVPVIFMTGLTETEAVLRGFESGGVDYVTKPIVAEELLARVRTHLANARLTRSAQVALDATGRYLLASNRAGQLLWSTPQAAEKLHAAFAPGSAEGLLPPEVAGWLARVVSAEDDRRNDAFPALHGGENAVHLSFVGQIGPDEYLLRLTQENTAQEEKTLRERLGLTNREAEVLLWVKRGKASRDIAQILKLSARTVDKHLEQIYTKLGVENRTSAAAIALRALGG